MAPEWEPKRRINTNSRRVGRVPKAEIFRIFENETIPRRTIYRTIADCEQGIPCLNLRKKWKTTSIYCTEGIAVGKKSKKPCWDVIKETEYGIVDIEEEWSEISKKTQVPQIHSRAASTYTKMLPSTEAGLLCRWQNIILDDATKENDLQSYENPNYHLNPSNRLYDALNSNTDDIYDSVYQELDNICNIGHGVNEPLNCNVGRKSYATLDIESMGVDINKGPLTQISSSILIDNRRMGTANHL
ncbi:hypothetical protein NQ317_005241 [Molorchus minor]|uniref:Uncharacterized protein n=1 Tax=Molorchus minor TaxID=1323400 RepID=A0ABQ9JGH4_9CUCU|nr:hypothetical protein NQ317_005241 [Molorchus minor]